VAGRVYLLQLRRMREYSVNFLSSTVTVPIMLLVTVFVWKVVFAGRSTVNGYRFEEIVAYYLLVQLVSLVINQASAVAWYTWQDINSGDLGTYLARPIDYPLYNLARTAGPMSLYLGLGLTSYAVVATVFGLPLAGNLPGAVFFMVSVVNGFLIWFLLQFLLGAAGFWIGRPYTLRDLVFEVHALFSGLIIPNDFLPSALQAIASALPFQQIYYMPVAGLLGRIEPSHMAQATLTQAAWVVGLFVASRILWARGIRRFEAQGG